MSQILSLYRLQQTDSQIDRIQARLLILQNMLDNDNELRLVKEQDESANLHYHTVCQTLKLAENEVLDQRIKIEQTEASLYSGKGHSPKELLDLQNDLSALKRHQEVLEDVQISAMVAVEEAEKRNEVIKVQLIEATNKSFERNQSLHKEQESLQKDLQKLFSERSANSNTIPLEAMKLYNTLRQDRRGIAVSVISDRSCSACGAGLSPAQIQASRSSGQMTLCPSCGRILYGN